MSKAEGQTSVLRTHLLVFWAEWLERSAANDFFFLVCIESATLTQNSFFFWCVLHSHNKEQTANNKHQEQYQVIKKQL